MSKNQIMFFLIVLAIILSAFILFGDDPSESRQETCFNFFVEKGLTPIQAAAIVGNLRQESSCNPKSENPDSGAYGIAQWLLTRKDDLYAFAERDKGNRSASDIMLQLDFLWHEMTQGDEKKTLMELKKETVLATDNKNGSGGAVETFCILFERCSEGERVLRKRCKYARSVLERYGP